VKKYNHYLITLLISGVFGTLLALIFGQVQGAIIPIAVVIVLIVLIVVIGVGTASDQPDGIAEIFRAIWSGLAEVIRAVSQLRKQSE
jgi:hypothetical protein